MATFTAPAQPRPAVGIYDVAVPGSGPVICDADHLSLPDPLTTTTGRKNTTAAEWKEIRRTEILPLFKTHVYGHAPTNSAEVTFNVFDESLNALSGTAIRKQVAVKIGTAKGTLRGDLLLYLPRSAEQRPGPFMTLLNFHGNHTVNADPAIAVPQDIKTKLRQNAKILKYPEAARGASSARYPLQDIINRGYGLATVFPGDIDPNLPDDHQNGIHFLLDPQGECFGIIISDNSGSTGKHDRTLSDSTCFMDYADKQWNIR
jgi:hypothetical protein